MFFDTHERRSRARGTKVEIDMMGEIGGGPVEHEIAGREFEVQRGDGVRTEMKGIRMRLMQVRFWYRKLVFGLMCGEMRKGGVEDVLRRRGRESAFKEVGYDVSTRS